MSWGFKEKKKEKGELGFEKGVRNRGVCVQSQKAKQQTSGDKTNSWSSFFI
jgi:hypothetical protein